jgi:hypothetical protein
MDLSADDRRSVRDRLAHWEAVDAGVLNVYAKGGDVIVRLAGGGESLTAFPPHADPGHDAGLASALVRRGEQLHAFVLGMVTDLGTVG